MLKLFLSSFFLFLTPLKYNLELQETDCHIVYIQAINELQDICKQDSFLIEWTSYMNTLSFIKIPEILTTNKKHSYSELKKLTFQIDTIFVTYESPSLGYPFDNSLEVALITLLEEDSILYRPTNSYIHQLEDIYLMKNCYYETLSINSEKINCLTSNPNNKNELNINLFLSRLYENRDFNVVSIGMAFSDLTAFHEDDPYTEGNIFYTTLYLSKIGKNTIASYSHSIGLTKPLGVDTLIVDKYKK